MGQYAAAVIEAERARGAAPGGPPPRDLAIALIYMNERVMQTTLAGDEPAVPGESVIDVLLDIWRKAIYAELPHERS
ncbi:MAG: hypothetical protein ACYC91_07540 [Solirubrobacteraceae bacterium]